MTTKYFRNFNTVAYRFGDNEKPVMFNDLTQYVDLIDGIKDNISFYNQYTIISGDRPVTTNDEIATNFPVGTTVTGTTSNTVGTIVARRLEFGQLIIDTVDDNNFGPTESIQYLSQEGAFYTAQLVKESTQYDAIHHYMDSQGVYQDLPLFDFANPSALWIPVTYRDRLNMANEDLKEIVVLRPDVITKVVSEFNNFHKQAT